MLDEDLDIAMWSRRDKLCVGALALAATDILYRIFVRPVIRELLVRPWPSRSL